MPFGKVHVGDFAWPHTTLSDPLAIKRPLGLVCVHRIWTGLVFVDRVWNCDECDVMW